MKKVLIFLLCCNVYKAEAQDISPWIAPEYTKEWENVVLPEDFEDSVKEGKYLFSKLCKSCHGKEGKGDGRRGQKYNPRPANLTLDVVQRQKDGEIYWKISHGRNKMIRFKYILSEEEKWFLVNFIRTLVKESVNE